MTTTTPMGTVYFPSKWTWEQCASWRIKRPFDFADWFGRHNPDRRARWAFYFYTITPQLHR